MRFIGSLPHEDLSGFVNLFLLSPRGLIIIT
jgi:hypothetical protein